MTRRYLDQTMVLETTFQTATGTLVLVDAMALGPNDRGHHLGAGSPGALLRRLDCTEGEEEIHAAILDPASGELLGNFPQAFSHIGLVNAAWTISLADRHSRP